jgi:uncharacterized membrane protein YdjX (TVP38/TMEM64 family)
VLLFIAGLVCLAILWMVLPVGRWVLDLADWFRSAGTPGLVVYTVVYILGASALFPESLLTIAAGFVYGPVWGTILVSPVSVAAATAAFLTGRFVARDWIAGKIAANPKFTAIDGAVGSRGFYIVFLLRLSPVFPFNLLNYALGLTRVRLRDYMLASFIGMLPGTFLYTYLGSLITNAAQLTTGAAKGGAAGHALFYGGLMATMIVTVLIVRISRNALKAALDQAARTGDSKVGATAV